VNAEQALYEAFEVKHYFAAFSTSFIPVSLFDLESRFFVPTHRVWGSRRAQGLSRPAVVLHWGLTLRRFQAAP
jgi:hypothetical protein